MLKNVTLRVRLIIILLIAVTIPIIVTGELMMNQAENALLNEKKVKLFGYARLLDQYLQGSYNDILSQERALDTDRAVKIKVLNMALRDYTDEVARTHPGLGIGYYSKELDAILTYGSSKEYGHTVGQSIFPGHQGYTVMETGEEMVQIGDLVRGNIMNCMVPIKRNGIVIGYIWSNELMKDVDAQIGSMETRIYDTIIIGVFFALTMAYFLTGSIARDVETIKNGLKTLPKDMTMRLPALHGEMGDITRAINEMSWAMSSMKRHAESIAASTPNGLITLNTKGLITIYNKAAERITGISGKEAIDKHYLAVFENWPDIQDILNNAFHGELFQNKEMTITINRRQIPLLISTSALVNNINEELGTLVLMSDLTDTKKLEEQVRRADKLALIGELAAGVAHEVRNPLTAITGYLQLLGMDFSSDDPRREFTTIISTEVSRLNHLIDQLLYFSRPLPPLFIITNLNKVLQDTLLLLDNPGIRKKVLFRTVFSPGLPQVKIDVGQFKQVLINIVLNGIQAIEDQGCITIKSYQDPETGYVAVDIRDTGTGIPPENIPRIFDPFYTSKEKGTGLGLAVADKIMEVHRGYIEVSSEPGKGTCFTIYLPPSLEVSNDQ